MITYPVTNDILWKELREENQEIRGSFFEKKILKCEEKFKSEKFIGYTLPNKMFNGQKEFLEQTNKIFYPLINAMNKINSTMLPELIDVFVCSEGEIKKLMLVMEYIKGYTLKEAVNHYKSYKKQAADFPTTLNISKFSKVLKKLTDFSEDLLNEGYFHLGLYPSHFILPKSDVIRLTGLRFIMKTEGFIVNDPRIKSLKNEMKYSFMPPELYTKIYKESNNSINAIAVLAYQIGILILWGYYQEDLGIYRIADNQIDLSDEIFDIVPYNKKRKVSDAVWALLDPDPDIRLNTLQEIRECLDSIE